jgi:hypothetical protein
VWREERDLSFRKVGPREPLFFAVETARPSFAVLRREWKLVREGTDRLFQIDEDPNEDRDLAARHPAMVRELAGELQQWISLHPTGGIRNSPKPPAGWEAPPQWAEAAAE